MTQLNQCGRKKPVVIVGDLTFAVDCCQAAFHHVSGDATTPDTGDAAGT